jgi:CubicO group peptidase (beta-lactamase class C family)
VGGAYGSTPIVNHSAQVSSLTSGETVSTERYRKEDIEYCVGGGGIYSNTGNYIKLLHHLLVQRLFLLGQVSTRSPVTILSDESTNSLFQPSLTDSALHGMAAMLNRWFMQTEQEGLLEAGDANWGTAVAIYTPRDRRPRGGFGRRPNTIGWGGAAGTEFWIDPAAGIAVSAVAETVAPGKSDRFRSCGRPSSYRVRVIQRYSKLRRTSKGRCIRLLEWTSE